MSNIDLRLDKLAQNKFRQKFHLSIKDKDYIAKKGIATIKDETRNILINKLRIKQPNDGRQTPYKGHPTFTSQHATATCCRQCMKKWYNVEENIILNDKLIDYFLNIIITFIQRELKK